MKCPNCKIEMERGALTNHGNIWAPVKKIIRIFWWGKHKVFAYKCNNCGKIELMAKKENE